MSIGSRVVVAMSGGVDSSVAAALLMEQGFDVVGVTMRIWDDDQVFTRDMCPNIGKASGGRGCCGMAAIDDARRVAQQLGIPHYTYDFRRDFQKTVVDDFCAEYARGRTPNPCIRCNKFLKFDLLLRKAEELGAGQVATGHYARVASPGSGPPTSNPASERTLLKRSADPTKDQTYFLYSLTQQQLERSFFPLGDMTKSAVREQARRLGLMTAEKKESQEVCFAPGGAYVDFLRVRFPEMASPGPILDSSGAVIGEHKGIVRFTIGQRRRIGIASREPYYVVRIDPVGNAITVGREAEVYGDNMLVRDLNLISVPSLSGSLRLLVKIRHQQKPTWAEVSQVNAETIAVKFEVPQWAITPGQAAVFYDGDAVVGGGIIV